MRVNLFIAIATPLIGKSGPVSLLINRKGWFNFNMGVSHLFPGQPEPTITTVCNIPHADPQAVLLAQVTHQLGVKATQQLQKAIKIGRIKCFKDTAEKGHRVVWYGVYIPNIQNCVRLDSQYGCLDVIDKNDLDHFAKKESGAKKTIPTKSLCGKRGKLIQAIAQSQKLETVDTFTFNLDSLTGEHLIMALEILKHFEQLESNRRKKLPQIVYG
jgi:hypothetical protein